MSAQTFTTLASFSGTPTGGYYPYDSLAQGPDGKLFGTTYVDTVFKISLQGSLTTTYVFCTTMDCPSGANPAAALVLATDGNFYGTTFGGGNPGCDGQNAYQNGCGTIFKITPSGTLTTLYSFCHSANCADGASPYAGLVQATNGSFYGTTVYGGADNLGTVFEISPTGKFTTLYSFGAYGYYPYGTLIQATDGNLYGTTNKGGDKNYGTVFKITPAGELTTLYSFHPKYGGWPYSGVVQGTDGNFYGTTSYGGINQILGGTVFEITPTGALTTLYNFCSQSNCSDGKQPHAALVQGTDGNFYGTTEAGGTPGEGEPSDTGGTAFKITPTGQLTTLYNFCSQSDCTDGDSPLGGLVQATDGNFYGTTWQGGTDNGGTVFSLSLGLDPFAETLPTSGKVGSPIVILGQGFTGATALSFNGTPASFSVKADTYLKASVPSGATTGSVTVTTPSGILSSKIIFRVTPQIMSFSPTSGPVGTTVTITGVSLTQTTQVTFGSLAAAFTVNSDTQVTATVPSGAVTKKINITTPGGVAVSATQFTVTQ